MCILEHMTTTLPPQSLEFDLADRMAKALRVSGFSVQSVADELRVSRRAVSNWINGHVEPSRATLIAWAHVTGVPFEWLNDEEPAPVGTGSVGVVRPEGFEPPTFWLGATRRDELALAS